MNKKMKSLCSIPELRIEEIILNETNPFKKKLHTFRIRCVKCGEVVLGRPVTRRSDWAKIQIHLDVRHGIKVDDGIPVRLFSATRFRRWVKAQKLTVLKSPLMERSSKMVLLEGYIGAWKKYPTDEVKIRVARPSILAPSEDLLREFMAAKREFMREHGLSEHEARQAAVGSMSFEQRFRDQILNNPEALKRLQEIKKLAETKNVRLLCYEKEPPCHRFILIEMIKELKT